MIEAFAPGHKEKPATPAAPAAEPAAGAPATPGTLPEQPTPEMAALVSDLHWLIHEGHVIEFANGIMETAKRPLPKPVRVEKPKPEAKPEGSTAEATAAPEGAESAGEVTSESVPNVEGPTGETSHAAETSNAETPAAEPSAQPTPAA